MSDQPNITVAEAARYSRLRHGAWHVVERTTERRLRMRLRILRRAAREVDAEVMARVDPDGCVIFARSKDES